MMEIVLTRRTRRKHEGHEDIFYRRERRDHRVNYVYAVQNPTLGQSM